MTLTRQMCQIDSDMDAISDQYLQPPQVLTTMTGCSKSHK